ncbi:MAG TPA: glycosyltransferase family 2 protein [Candidatus Saccharimonadales bacterium]|nr:glycosyltransferase family 2 protein [Candidatus Saccharimonadales bacterium]
MTTLSIIILSFNTKDLITICIQSLLKQYQEEISERKFEIIIVDNASTDGSIPFLKSQKWATHIKFIENNKNYGFAKGCNIGAKHASARLLLFLNSDTQIEDKGLDGMVEFLEKNEKVGILGGKLSNPDGSAQLYAGTFYTLSIVLLMLIGAERFGLSRFSPSHISQVDWVSGGSMMVQKNMFDELGGFDETFFMYLEDMELCYRAFKKGYLTYYYPSVTIIHKQHGSSNRSFAIVHIYEGLLYFYKKHKSSLEYRVVRGALRMKARVLIFLGKILDNTYLTKTYEEALTLS